MGHIPEKDGILAGILVAEAIAMSGKPLSQLVEEAVTEAGGPLYEKRIDLHLVEKQTQILQQIEDIINQLKPN